MRWDCPACGGWIEAEGAATLLEHERAHIVDHEMAGYRRGVVAMGEMARHVAKAIADGAVGMAPIYAVDGTAVELRGQEAEFTDADRAFLTAMKIKAEGDHA